MLHLSRLRNKVQTLKSHQTITNRNKVNTTKKIKITLQVSHTSMSDGCLMICCYGTILDDFCENISIQLIKFNEFNLQKLNLNAQFHNHELNVPNLKL